MSGRSNEVDHGGSRCGGLAGRPNPTVLVPVDSGNPSWECTCYLRNLPRLVCVAACGSQRSGTLEPRGTIGLVVNDRTVGYGGI